MPRALISVSDKRGLVDFARGLLQLGWEIVSTGGTAHAAGRLVELCGGEVAGYAFVVHLSFLGGLAQLGGHPVQFLVEF